MQLTNLPQINHYLQTTVKAVLKATFKYRSTCELQGNVSSPAMIYENKAPSEYKDHR